MKTTKHSIASLCTLISLTILGPHIWAGPFTNGSFELPQIPTNSWVGLPIGDTSVTGWLVGGASSGTVLESGYPSSGSIGPVSGGQFIVMDAGAWPAGSTIAQSFDTTPGHSYAVSFNVGKWGGLPGQMQITATATASDGSVLGILTGSRSSVGWGPTNLFTFTATTSTSTLTFEDTTTTTTNTDVALDNVSVQDQGPFTEGLLAYYPLSTDGKDQSGNGFDLTCSNVLFSGSASTNPAALFDGTDSYCVGNQTFIVRQTNWSWSAWVYVRQPASGDSAYQSIYQEGRQGGGCLMVGVYPQSATLEVEAWNVAYPGNWLAVSVPVDLRNRWTHIALTLNNGGVGTGTLNVFLNGGLAQSSGFQQVDPGDMLPRIGVLGNGWLNSSQDFTQAPFKGSINNVRFYNRTLSVSEVQQLYAFEAAPRIVAQPQSQVGYWGMGASFHVGAASPLPVSYQWFDQGLAISWATNSTLSLSNLDFTDAGDYWAVVTNSVASVTSTPANLLVNPAGVSLGMYPGLTIQGVVGRTYGIQYVTSLSETNQWTTLTSITLAQPVQLWVDTNANASLPINSQRFYRVIAVP